MEIRCYRKILHISYKNHVTNEEVRAKIQQAIAPHEDLLTIVKRRKLQRYGHVSRSSGLAKTILQGTVKGKENKADKGRDGKTTSGNGQIWCSASPRRQWSTGENGENWLRNHLWCPICVAVKGLMMMMIQKCQKKKKKKKCHYRVKTPIKIRNDMKV